MNHPPSRTIFPAHVCAMVAVAQLVEHQIVVLRVAGSSPVSHPLWLLSIMRLSIFWHEKAILS